MEWLTCTLRRVVCLTVMLTLVKYGFIQLHINALVCAQVTALVCAQVAEDELNLPFHHDEAPDKQILCQIIVLRIFVRESLLHFFSTCIKFHLARTAVCKKYVWILQLPYANSLLTIIKKPNSSQQT